MLQNGILGPSCVISGANWGIFGVKLGHFLGEIWPLLEVNRWWEQNEMQRLVPNLQVLLGQIRPFLGKLLKNGILGASCAFFGANWGIFGVKFGHFGGELWPFGG